MVTNQRKAGFSMKRKFFKKALAGLLIGCLFLFASCNAVSKIIDANGDSSSDSTDTSDSSGIQYTSATAVIAEDAEDAKISITADFTVTTEVENGYTQNGSVYTITKAGE